MRLHLKALAAVAVAVPFLCSSPAFAGHNTRKAIRWEKADLIAEATPDAAAVFGCELRFFDPNLNGGNVPCYGPSAIRAAYGVDSLIAGGANGAGRTIVILDAFGSPTAFADVKAFDAIFHLPDPGVFTVVTMPGTPAFDSTDGNQVGWAEETSLDLQWSHAMAPAANIVLIQAASNSDDDLLAGLNYAIDHHLGDVVSMSFSESEFFLTDADGQRVIAAWEKAFQRARLNHITLLASSGDEGSTNTGDGEGDVLPFPNVGHPASSPLVTGVGGTNLFFGKPGPNGITDGKADPNGSYLGEKVWNDESANIAAAGGGGVSAIFRMPDYQFALPLATRRSLNGHRGVPDVSYNAGVVGGVIVHLGFPGVGAGFYIFGGTSAGSPQWAGLVADVNGALGHPAGFLNGKLYRMGQAALTAGLFHDITTGDNGFCFFTTPNGDFACIPGFAATPRWDLATGWGSPSFGSLLTLLHEWDLD